ncbi:MAG: hypothetical protein ACTSUS_04695 [Candidatus Freyarchaeota archaeon]
MFWKDFLKPDWRRILLFGTFLFIMVAAHIQSYAFIDGEEVGIPKPPLYDVLSPFPFWAMWISLIMPLALLYMPFRFTGLSQIVWTGWLVYLIQAVYFYLASCFIFYSYEKHSDKFSRKFWDFAVAISFILSFVLGGAWNLLFIAEWATYLVGGAVTLLLYIYVLSSVGLFVHDMFKTEK